MLSVILGLIPTIFGMARPGIDKAFGRGATETIQETITSVMGANKALLTAELSALGASDIRQVSLLAIDAKSARWFQAMGRPAALWICNLGLLYAVLGQHILAYVFAYLKIEVEVMPIDTVLLLTILVGLLGLSGFRHIDKQAQRKKVSE